MFFNNAHCLVTDTGSPLADDAARRAYLAALEKARADLGLKVPAYALLPGRALLYFVTPGADLRAVMRTLSADPARCKYKLLQPEKYSAALARYIHLEPVKEGLAARPEEYPWSSAAQYLGAPGLADKDVALAWLGDTPQARAAAYPAFMAEPVPGKLWRPFAKNRDAVLGDRDFTAAHSPHL
ncbi:MAG: hypothetical protein NDI60_09870 [Elusimicrobiales bacterium]|nr:hypothetical protein [Elusimicrobiales bacterium]